MSVKSILLSPSSLEALLSELFIIKVLFVQWTEISLQSSKADWTFLFCFQIFGTGAKAPQNIFKVVHSTEHTTTDKSVLALLDYFEKDPVHTRDLGL